MNKCFQKSGEKTICKFLGVLKDCNLSWNDQLMWHKSKTIGIIAKLRHVLPTSVSSTSPHLSFGLVVWGRTSKTNLEKILIPKERALRLIYFSSNFEHAIPARIWDKIPKYLKSKPKESFKENLQTESLQILERQGVYADVYNIAD